MANRVWFPRVHQLRFNPNDNWFHSVWLGVFWPIISFWPLFMANFIGPVLIFRPLWRAIPLRLLATMIMHIKLPVLGILGMVNSENITLEEIEQRMIEFVNSLAKMKEADTEDSSAKQQ